MWGAKVQVQVQVLYWHIHTYIGTNSIKGNIQIPWKGITNTQYFLYYWYEQKPLSLYMPMGQETIGGLWAPEFVSQPVYYNYNRVQRSMHYKFGHGNDTSSYQIRTGF